MSLPVTLTKPVQIWRGDSFALSVSFQAPLGTPVNLSTYGAGVHSQLRANTTRAAADASFAVDTSQLADGIIELSLTPAQTSALGLRAYGFDVEFTDTAGTITTLLRGMVAMDGDYTRAAR